MGLIHDEEVEVVAEAIQVDVGALEGRDRDRLEVVLAVAVAADPPG